MVKDKQGLVKEAVSGIRDFTDIAVIGLSGGADSTLVTILCKMALGKENVYVVHMPHTELDNQTFNAMSRQIAHHLQVEEYNFPIFFICSEFQKSLLSMDLMFEQKLIGNIKARIRMTALYAVAESIASTTVKRVRVIGTDNLSENALGYFTKYGDGGVDFNPIGCLYKSEVYQLLDHFRDTGVIEEEHINRVPSAGLWEGQTDEGELGITYDEVEKALRRFRGEGVFDLTSDLTLGEKIVSEMRDKTHHKRELPPEIQSVRYFCD